MLDVLIVGAGPAGLALANSIKHHSPGMSCKVVERTRTISAKGAGLRFEPNGLKALQAISPELHREVLQACCRPSRAVKYNMDGSIERTIDLNKGMFEGSPFIGWSDLQGVLRSQLPEGTVLMGCPFTSFEQHEEGVLVHFGEAQPSLEARLLVGCDGYQSRVRQQWLQDGPPSFAGTVIWRGRVRADASPELGRDATTMDLRGNSVMAVYAGSEDYVVWNLSMKEEAMQDLGLERQAGQGPRGSLQNAPQEDDNLGEVRKQRALKVAEGHPAPLRRVVEVTDPSVILEHDVFLRPLAKYPPGCSLGGEGPVTLLGDAAHVIRPTGQGTNMALEDVVDLTRHLLESGPCTAAARGYEATRLPRWRLAAQHSELQVQTAYGAAVDRQKLGAWEQELWTFEPSSLLLAH